MSCCWADCWCKTWPPVRLIPSTGQRYTVEEIEPLDGQLDERMFCYRYVGRA